MGVMKASSTDSAPKVGQAAAVPPKGLSVPLATAARSTEREREAVAPWRQKARAMRSRSEQGRGNGVRLS